MENSFIDTKKRRIYQIHLVKINRLLLNEKEKTLENSEREKITWMNDEKERKRKMNTKIHFKALFEHDWLLNDNVKHSKFSTSLCLSYAQRYHKYWQHKRYQIVHSSNSNSHFSLRSYTSISNRQLEEKSKRKKQHTHTHKTKNELEWEENDCIRVHWGVEKCWMLKRNWNDKVLQVNGKSCMKYWLSE